MTEPRKPGRPPERVVLTFFFKMALSTPPQVRNVPWPKNWPIPQPGDQIVVDDLVGIVMNLSFHPTENKLIVNLR